MNTWLQVCENARETVKKTASMLLDQQTSELFSIYQSLSALGEESANKNSGAVTCGLYAASYRIAGSLKVVSNVADQALINVNELKNNSQDGEETTSALQIFSLATTNKKLHKNLLNHQAAVRNLAQALQDDCRNDLMHLTRELEVIQEHPFTVADDSFHRRLQFQHDILEELVESFYEKGSQLLEHPVLDINVALWVS